MSDRRAFVARHGGIAEGSPWVAERAFALGPGDDPAAVAGAFARVIREASPPEQEALLRAHPDLGERVALTPASAGEQASAGLDRLAAGDRARLVALTAAYRERFGYPFVIRVRGRSVTEILAACEERLAGDPAAERGVAVEEVVGIVRLRLGAESA